MATFLTPVCFLQQHMWILPCNWRTENEGSRHSPRRRRSGMCSSDLKGNRTGKDTTKTFGERGKSERELHVRPVWDGRCGNPPRSWRGIGIAVWLTFFFFFFFTSRLRHCLQIVQLDTAHRCAPVSLKEHIFSSTAQEGKTSDGGVPPTYRNPFGA